MTDQLFNPDLGDTPPSTAVLLRLEADGELPDAWRPALRDAMQADPHAEDRLAFEHTLRFRVSKVMVGKAPEGLAERIQQMFAEADAQSGATSATSTPAAGSPGRAFSLRRRLTRYAMAAGLALLLGATGLILWQSRDGVPVLTYGSDVLLSEASTRIFNFVEAQARTCGDFQKFYEHKMTVRELRRVPAELSDHLREDAPAPDLSARGYEFKGAGECAVPFYGPSVHYVYARSTPAGPMPLSFFVQHGEGPQDMQTGVLYELTQPGSATRAYTWHEAEMIYYLVPAPGEQAETVLELLDTLAAPETRVPLDA